MKLQDIIQLDTIITLKKDITAADMDEEKVMMNLDRGKYYALNNVGSRIWDLIDRPQQVSSIVFKLLEEYDIDQDTCRDNVLVFLNRLYYEELICVQK